MFDFTGKVAIVTGGTKGIGRSIASELTGVGANIVVVSRNQDQCNEVALALSAKGAEAFPFACDVSKKEDRDALVTAVKNKFGKIDILINNAGTAVTKPALELTEDDWDRVQDLNLKGVFFLTQTVAQEMINQGNGGRIVNIASMFGLIGDKNILPYLTSKGGLIQMTRGLALEWARHNITVNAVAPGYVITSINEKELTDERIGSVLLKKTPLRRFGTPEEVAGTVVYLASDEASFVTGSVYAVDGGWMAQ
jgi:NAD(P)-dependent dehydrogenase (short-subunit alcohol dehydrogenase family)